MSEEKDLAQLKKEAAARAKEAALAKMQAQKNAETTNTAPPTIETSKKETPTTNEEDLKRLKKEAVEKAKAEAQAKLAAKKEVEAEAPADETEEEKIKRLKREAVAKAKAEAQAKLAAKKEAEAQVPADETEEEKIKRLKREAVAKAKAEAQAKLAAKKAEEAGENPVEETEEEKTKRLKREAVARAKQEALEKKTTTNSEALSDEQLKEQKRLAVEKAKAQAEAKKQTNTTTAPPEDKKSKNDPVLEKYIKVIEDHIGKEVIKEAYINFSSKEVPTIIIDSSVYFRLAKFLRFNEQLAFDALVELHATDFESSIELYIYLYSYFNKQHLVLKTQLERNNPEIESITPIWPGANWPECEAYDLLGVNFKGHPYLHRILLGEDWIGHPLRKDYKAYDDVEV